MAQERQDRERQGREGHDDTHKRQQQDESNRQSRQGRSGQGERQGQSRQGTDQYPGEEGNLGNRSTREQSGGSQRNRNM